jgi:hypothetical protein
MKKHLFFILLLIGFCAESAEQNSYRASLYKVYPDIGYPERALFNRLQPNILAVKNTGGDVYIINLSNNQLIKVNYFGGFFDKYAVVSLSSYSADNSLLLYDPLTGQHTDILTMDDRSEFLKQAGKMVEGKVAIKLKSEELKSDLVNILYKFEPYEEPKLTKDIMDKSDRVVYTHDQPIWNPVMSHDGSKCVFMDNSTHWYLLNIPTKRLLEIPLPLAQRRGKTITKFVGTPPKAYSSAITDIVVDVGWFWDNSMLFLQYHGDDHDGAIMEETSYIYEVVGNKLSRLELPQEIINSKPEPTELGDISQEGDIALFRGKLCIIRIDWKPEKSRVQSPK